MVVFRGVFWRLYHNCAALNPFDHAAVHLLNNLTIGQLNLLSIHRVLDIIIDKLILITIYYYLVHHNDLLPVDRLKRESVLRYNIIVAISRDTDNSRSAILSAILVVF